MRTIGPAVRNGQSVAAGELPRASEQAAPYGTCQDILWAEQEDDGGRD